MSKEYLARAFQTHSLPSTFLFSGSEAKEAALELSAKLLVSPVDRIAANNHPDFHRLTPDSKGALHTIESIRLAVGASQAEPFLGQAAVFLLESADQMQPVAASALLKTLEEPSKKSTWILLSDRPEEILPTIRSRCTRLVFQENTGAIVLGEEAQIIETLFSQKLSYHKLGSVLEQLEQILSKEEAGKLETVRVLVSEQIQRLGAKEESFPAEELLATFTTALERNIKLSACLEYLFLKIESNVHN